MAPGQTHQGQAHANPHSELNQFGARAAAIADAAMKAAGQIQQTTTFTVTYIEIVVDPNPGPKSYSATITEI